MSNDHENISLLICKQLVGTITADEQQTLEQWRKQNPYNEAVYQRLQDNQRLQVEHHRRQLTDYHRALNDMKRRVDRNGERRRWWLSAAAAALLLIGVGLGWQQFKASESEAQQALVADEIRPGTTQATLTLASGKTVNLRNETLYPQPSTKRNVNGEAQKGDSKDAQGLTLTTPRGGEFRVVLEDGTEVWLNAASRLSYPEVFDGPERRVELEGEAYFRVAKNAEQPFIVVSGGQEVRVLGTEFNIHAYSDEPDICTTLIEGSITLRKENSDGRELMLTPGHQTLYNVEASTFHVKTVDTDVVASWRSGTFVFEDQTLEQIMRTLSRWYDFDYEFRDRKTAATVFMGSIPKYGTFDEVCDIFHKLGGIRLRQQGRKIIITEK